MDKFVFCVFIFLSLLVRCLTGSKALKGHLIYIYFELISLLFFSVHSECEEIKMALKDLFDYLDAHHRIFASRLIDDVQYVYQYSVFVLPQFSKVDGEVNRKWVCKGDAVSPFSKYLTSSYNTSAGLLVTFQSNFLLQCSAREGNWLICS